MHFLRDILRIIDDFSYSSSFETVNYHFLDGLYMMIQIYNYLACKGFITERRREPLHQVVFCLFWVVLKLHLSSKCCTFQKRTPLQVFWRLDLVAETCYLSCAVWFRWHSYFLALSSRKSLLSCPLNVSIITSDICSFGYAILYQIWSKYGNIIS